MKNEMPTEVILNALSAIKIHNPEAFHLFYGGEPLLRKDLYKIINHCHKNNIHYTIISNNTPEIQPKIEKLVELVGPLQGFTASVDPMIFDESYSKDDRFKKSIEGMKNLINMKEMGYVKDAVAEITVLNQNINLLYPLVFYLSGSGIYSDITFADIKKSKYYDFSNIDDVNSLVEPKLELAKILLKMLEDDQLLIHMKEYLLPKMFDTLPSNFDCELEKGIHNITIDADGSMRLCLRIKGLLTPNVHIKDLFDKTYPTLISEEYFNLLKIDKKRYCQLCNHSCLMMSHYIDQTEKGESDLIHKDKREEK
jgi:MoaA/NifB/PqqE/SkfB family radical SAM enzyme